MNFEDGRDGFSSLEMQVRDWNGTVRVSATLSPGVWGVKVVVVTSGCCCR